MCLLLELSPHRRRDAVSTLRLMAIVRLGHLQTISVGHLWPVARPGGSTARQDPHHRPCRRAPGPNRDERVKYTPTSHVLTEVPRGELRALVSIRTSVSLSIWFAVTMLTALLTRAVSAVAENVGPRCSVRSSRGPRGSTPCRRARDAR